jgi:anti-sigma regulatory factor (Ser/Thr protein kinase)
MARARIRLAADEQAVARVMGWVERFCNRHRLSQAVTDVVCLSLEEVVSNIIEHGYERQPGMFSIELHYDHRALSAVIEDGGKPFNPMQAAIPHDDGTLASRREGGFGLLLVKGLMDDMVYQRAGTINRLKLVKLLGC